MKEINEFDILENTEQSVIDRLSEEFPPDDAEEKEKVFRMSEEKFNKANSTYTETDEQVVSGVEVYRKPVWKKCLSAAAAAVILIGGTAGGIKAYKYFHNAPTKTEEEKKIAPFGDFMETKYQICDYTAEPLFTITPNNTDADEDTDDLTEFDVSIYGGTDIPEDKRQMLADFINSYDYKEVYTLDPEHPFPPHQTEKNDPVAEALLRGEEPPEPQYENLTGLDELVYAPFFIYVDEDRIKSITIDETNNKGGLTYTEFSYIEEDGEYLISNSDYLTKAYEIDYDLFKTTINDILNSNEKEPEYESDYCYKIAPFGDFAELEYELCDFDADLSPRIIDEESVEHAHRLGIDNIVSTTYLPACTPISQDHREKLAELFNNYNFEGNFVKSYVYDPEKDLIILNKNGETIELDSMDSEDHSDQMHSNIFRSNADAIHLSPINPYMIYETDDEVRFLSFYQFDDYGAMNYCRIKFEDIDGTRHLFNDTMSMTSYEIDYDYFVDTMEAILEDREYTIRKGSSAPTSDKKEARSVSCPFDFSAHDFFIPKQESNTNINIYIGKPDDELGNGQTCFTLNDGDIIPLEKRQKLADFFNSYNWEEIDEYPYNIISTHEQICFYSLSDDDLIHFYLDRSTNTMTFINFKIELEFSTEDESMKTAEPHRWIKYNAADENITVEDVVKIYKIDYNLFKSKIKEILGDDFIEPQIDNWSFFGKEWSIETNESAEIKPLTDEDKQAIYEILKACNWRFESDDIERISTEEAMKLYNDSPLPENSDDYIILTSDYSDYHDILYIEATSDKLTARYYDIGLQGANIPGEEYNKHIHISSCDDTDIVSRIKEYLNK